MPPCRASEAHLSSVLILSDAVKLCTSGDDSREEIQRANESRQARPGPAQDPRGCRAAQAPDPHRRRGLHAVREDPADRALRAIAPLSTCDATIGTWAKRGSTFSTFSKISEIGRASC